MQDGAGHTDIAQKGEGISCQLGPAVLARVCAFLSGEIAVNLLLRSAGLVLSALIPRSQIPDKISEGSVLCNVGQGFGANENTLGKATLSLLLFE